MKFKQKLLYQSLLIALSQLSVSALAQEQQATNQPETTLDTIVVTAMPLRGTAESLAHPVELLHGEELDSRKSGTLGDTVSSLPGVQTTAFGAGVGRPIIRGQDGPRVQVLSGGISSMDVAASSADHAVSIEPFLADQIEVLKGPANLLFGSGAIGGAVNVVDGRLPDVMPDRPLSGRVELRGNSVNDEKTGMFRLDGVSGNWAFHVDGLARNTGDYDIPGYARLEHDDHDDHDEHEGEEEGQVRGVLPNSSLRTRAGAVGITRFGEIGHFGLAVSTYRSDYGIPEGAHVDAHGDDEEDEEGDGHGEGPVRIDLVQNRIDLKAGLYNPVPFLTALNLRMAHNDYEHIEMEGDEVGTIFTNKGYEGRLEAVQNPIRGWRGAFGLQFGHVDFSAVGEEAFVPPSQTDTLGLFVVQETNLGAWKLELGGRYDQVKIDSDTGISRDFGAGSLSGAAIWAINDTLDFRFGADLSERAPTNDELFASGAHIATRSYEIGDADLDTERGQRIEFGVHVHTSRMEFKAAVYQTKFSDFIYLADTGIEFDELPVRVWLQDDATFRGFEAEARFNLLEFSGNNLELRVFGDYVRAELNGSGTRTLDLEMSHGDHSDHVEVDLAMGGNLPRIAPARFGADLNWSLGGFRATLGSIHYASQNRVALHEERSGSYTLVNAGVAYRGGSRESAGWEVFLDGRNLTDEEARPHTSYVRDFAPLPGRSIAAGFRMFF